MWIDTAKAICIISIIMGHLNGRFPVFNTGLCVNNIVFAYHVPAFFILAGYTFKAVQISGEKATLHGVLEPPSRSNRATLSGK